MQTSSKQQEHSPRKESTSQKDNNNNNNKSDCVAQLVMNINSTKSAQQSSLSPNLNSSEPNKSNSANTIESDKEVEEITNRASKVDLNNGAASIINNNNNGTRGSQVDPGSSQQQQLIGSVALTMPGFISSEPVSVSTARQQTILTPSKLNLDVKQRQHHQRQRHQSSSKESVAKSDVEIGLDTKVPHPSTASSETTSAHNTEHLNSNLLFPGGAASSSCSNSIEEVSYYNDQSNLASLDATNKTNNGPSAASNNQPPVSAGSATTTSGSCSASSSSCSTSCNNNNNIAATGQPPIPVGSNGVSASGAVKSTRTKPVSAGREQKLSIVVPNSNSQLGPGFFSMTANSSSSSNNNNHRTTALDVSSREYCNDFDDYDTRYDTAAMEEDSIAPDDEQRQGNNYNNDFDENNSSPKAKSAPATPCNVTPTAFHQHNSNNKSNLPNPANTLPVDTRRNISATCRIVPKSISLAHANQNYNFTSGAAAAFVSGGDTSNNNGQLASAVSDQHLNNLIEEGETQFRHQNYEGAIRNFSQCIELATQNRHYDYLKQNFRVYSQRAEGYYNVGKYSQAIEDSMIARDHNSKWAQAHLILGKAQFELDKHVDSVTFFSFGLSQVPNDRLLFDALVRAALNSTNPKLDGFVDNFSKLRERDLHKDPFVVMASLGQELLTKHHHQHAAIVLESSLKLGTDNKRFKGSVLSTTSHVFCAIGDLKKALAYMKLELEIEKELNDVAGQCRVWSNIGYGYYKMGKFVKSLEAHRQQLKLAIQNNLFQQAAQAFNAIGHVHVTRNDFANALTSHEWCLNMLRRLGENEFDQFKELLAIGHVNALLADYKTSEDKYKEAIQVLDSSTRLRKDERQVGSIMVYFNLAYLALKRQSFVEATQHYETVINIARGMEGNHQKRLLYEIRALNGLGHAYRVFQRFDEAKDYFARQLELAKKVNDLSSLSQALSNLGMTNQHFKDYNTASKLFDENMQLVEGDPLLKAYAHSYRASMHVLWPDYTKAREEYERSLNIFKELEHCSAERKTIELNIDAISERLGRSQISLASNSARVQRKNQNRGLVIH